MAYSSLLFVLGFFLLAVAGHFFCTSVQLKNLALLAASLVFYLFAGLKSLILLLAVTLICWVWAKIIGESDNPELRKNALIITVVLCVLCLVVFQYFARFTASMNTLAPSVGQILIPVGMSVYTLELLGYVTDVYFRRTEHEPNFLYLLLFAGMFQLSAVGPVLRYRDFRTQLTERTVTGGDAGKGVARFSVGLAKLAVFANGCAAITDALFPQRVDTLYGVPALGIWVGVATYLLTFYFTLSGCSDMALGMGLIFGFHFPENFNYPLLAGSLKELGQRWMRPLSAFFGEYIYRSICKKRRRRQTAATLCTCLLLGIWYGASLNHLLWGLILFVFVMVEQRHLGRILKSLPKVVGVLWTLATTYIAAIFLGTNTISAPFTAIQGMFGGNENGIVNDSLIALLQGNVIFLLVAVLAATPLWTMLYNVLVNLGGGNRLAIYLRAGWEIAYPALLLLISVIALAGGSGTAVGYLQF